MKILKSNVFLLAVGIAMTCGYASAEQSVAEIGLQATASNFAPSGGVDETPDAFSFASVTDAEPGDPQVAPAVIVSGLDGPVTASVSGDGTPGLRVNAGPLESSTLVGNGDAVELSLVTASGIYATTYTATLTIGTASANFVVSTRAAPAADCTTIGDACSNGSIYAGLSPDGVTPMYTTPADAPSTYTWGDAVSYCANLDVHSSTDWVLPSYDDAGVLHANRDAIGGFNMGTSENYYAESSYWTSTEDEFGGALYFMFQYGEGWGTSKGSLNPVRCVRR